MRKSFVQASFYEEEEPTILRKRVLEILQTYCIKVCDRAIGVYVKKARPVLYSPL